MIHTPPAIYVKNARLQYAGHLLFDDLHCTLPAGKITCLLGASGIGKSSLLRLIAGLRPTDSSTLQTAEIITSDTHSLRERISYLAQNDLLLPWLSVLNNVLIGHHLRGTLSAKHETRARELLAQVGLGNVAHKLPAQLSGGMRQRVALARTLLEDRPVVLMDEPFSALDTVTRLRLQELAAQLLANRTVLLITHDPLEALRLGQHILVMSGSPAQLDASLHVPGVPPRSLTDDHVLHLQGELLQRLVNAQGGDT
jgi:putative hydroxymethylpyrimidine transport system ATP-binding protein